MKFKQNICPECGEPADGILERVSARALLSYCAEVDAFEYAGSSDVDWNTQRPDEHDGKVTLYCPEDHQWSTEWDPEYASASDGA